MSKPFVPRAYQGQMIQHAAELARPALWAGMGTGKTSATLAAIDLLHMVGDLTKPTLVVAPLRVAKFTWPDEAAKWDAFAGMEIVPIVGDLAARNAAVRRDAPVFTTNYEQLPWLVEKLGDRWPFGLVVADESTKLKGFRTRQGGARAKALGKVAHKTGRWLNLTGTPASNGLMDLWGQTWFQDAGERLGRSFSAFQQRWFRKGYDGFSFEPHDHSQGEIESKLQDICLTIDAKDWFDLREPIVNEIRIELPAKARALYQHMEKRMWMELAGQEIEAVNAAVKTMKCLQIANGAAYLEDQQWEEIHGAKLDALESVVAEAAGAPVLVAYHFKPDRERILRAFPGAIDLATDEGLRAAKAGRGRVWLAHPASLGHGVDGLQEHCTILCFFGHWWSLEQHDQIIERIGPTRQAQSGFDRAVHVHYLLAVDTVDELVRERQISKATVQDTLRAAMKRKTK